MERVRVEVYSDYTCPWCYIGSERLARVRDALAGEVELDIEWKPFEIHPEVPAEGMPVESLGYPPEQWAMMLQSLRREAEAEGLAVGSRGTVSNTHRALLASAYAQAEEPERFEAFHDALFRAYFAEGRDLGDPAVVREVAAAAGLDAERMDRALDAGRYDEALRETTREARLRGITGTPTYVLDGRYAVVGAQPTASLQRAVERLAREPG